MTARPIGGLALVLLLSSGCWRIKEQVPDAASGGTWMIRANPLFSDEIRYCTPPPLMCREAEMQ